MTLLPNHFSTAAQKSNAPKTAVSRLPLEESYDAVVDFCAYERKDIARAILLVIGTPKAENQTYILSAPEKTSPFPVKRSHGSWGSSTAA